MQRQLRFIVTGQEIKKDTNCDFSNIVANSRGYLVARFAFAGDWSGMQKVGLFYKFGKEYAEKITGNECIIPSEALTHTNFQVGICGVNGNTRIFTNLIKVEQINVQAERR